MNSESGVGIKETLPKNPRKISEDLPEDTETFSEIAKLSKDTRKQYFVRFPKKVAEALGLESVKDIEFIITTHLPDAKPENSELTVKLIRKLIWKEQEQLRKLTTLSNEILEKSYDEIISNKDFSKKLRGRVTMEELYKHIHKNHVRKLTVAQFKQFMQEFYEAYPLGDFSFERASIVYPEVARYGFITKIGVQFYMHKGG